MAFPEKVLPLEDLPLLYEGFPPSSSKFPGTSENPPGAALLPLPFRTPSICAAPIACFFPFPIFSSNELQTEGGLVPVSEADWFSFPDSFLMGAFPRGYLPSRTKFLDVDYQHFSAFFPLYLLLVVFPRIFAKFSLPSGNEDTCVECSTRFSFSPVLEVSQLLIPKLSLSPLLFSFYHLRPLFPRMWDVTPQAFSRTFFFFFFNPPDFRLDGPFPPPLYRPNVPPPLLTSDRFTFQRETFSLHSSIRPGYLGFQRQHVGRRWANAPNKDCDPLFRSLFFLETFVDF